MNPEDVPNTYIVLEKQMNVSDCEFKGFLEYENQLVLKSVREGFKACATELFGNDVEGYDPTPYEDLNTAEFLEPVDLNCTLLDRHAPFNYRKTHQALSNAFRACNNTFI